MANKMIKLMLLMLGAISIGVCGANGARPAVGEYLVTNGSFEDANSFAASGWLAWTESVPGTFSNTINTDMSKAYYGKNSLVIYRNSTNNSGCSIVYQELDVVLSGNGPKAGEKPEAGIWVMFDSAAAGDDGQIVLEIKSIVNGTITTMASSVYIANKQAGKWYYLMANSTVAIPADADKVQIAIISWLDGAVYVDTAQAGSAGSITGNPSKLALAEYHTWYGIPSYIPDWRRYSDIDYDFYDGYDTYGWKHWFWEWEPDGGYNNDPAFYEQIGIKATRKYTIVNGSFESSTYGSGNGDWDRYAPAESNNVRTDEKAYDGSYSVKFVNSSSTGQECSMWQWMPCNLASNPTGSNIANEREFVQASVMVNVDDVNFAAGKFCIQVVADGAEDVLIAKSYEYLSPDYIEANKDGNGWVQIKTRPVEKAMIPDGTTGLVVAVKFYYRGTIYIDKVEIGEAEYSNVQRQTACAKHPKPKIGPYDSSDADLIEYHLKLCKSMLFDVMLVDYYGSHFNQENYQRAALNAMIQKAKDEDMKVCAFYEPKVHLKQWGDVNYYTNMSNVSEMNAVDMARVNEYINENITIYTNVSQIADINVVKHYIKMAAIEDDIKYILDTWGGEKSYLAYRGKPVVAIFGMNMELPGSGSMTAQDWADIYTNLSQNDGSYNFVLVGDSSPDVADASGWYDTFTGMMNWHLLEDAVQDRMSPTTQYVYDRSKDVINGRSVNWAADGQGRFAVGLTYPQFNDLGVGAWGPWLEGGQWVYHINRTPSWNGDFYKMTNQGVMYNIDNINWVVVATFNDWNEGTAIEPSVEDGYLYSILTQEFLEDFKGVAEEPNSAMEQITEKYINMKIKMDIDTNIEQQELSPTGYNTYYRLSVHQFDSSGVWLGELVLKDWSMSVGTFMCDFAGRHTSMTQYVPCIRISTAWGAGWVKLDQIGTGSWVENFDSIANWVSFETSKISCAGSMMAIADGDGCGGALWNNGRINYTSGDVLTVVVNSLYDGVGSGRYYSGAACLKIVLDYEGFNEYTQTQLHNYAVAHNISNDHNLAPDPTGMYLTMNNYKLSSSYNYSALKATTRSAAYSNICYWMSYKVPGVSPRPEQMPAMLPLNGGYRDWVVVNGYSATGNPHGTDSYTINGFWITDPDISGLGKNLYMTAADVNNYYLPISSADSYNGYYVYVAEPPVGLMATATVAAPKAYNGFDGSKKSIIKAALKGVADNKLNQNNNFKSAFANANAGTPVLVTQNGQSYYVVPFIKGSGCTAAVIINAANGAFRQASYSDTPDAGFMERFNKKAKAKFRRGKSVLRGNANPFLPDVD